MAELILSPIVDKIIGRLGSDAVKQISLVWGVNDELQQLNETISTIKTVLLDAEKKQSHNNQVNNWLHRLGNAVLEADDLMDEVNTEALRRQLMMSRNPMANQVCTFFSGSNQLAFRFKMSRRIEGIKKKLADISKDRNFLLEKGETPSVRRARDTYSRLPQQDVIGREEDKSVIINKFLLESCEESVSVLAIVGIGGLGKTTLAQSVFNDEQVQKHFETKIWVCVSDDFDLKLIIKSIIESAKGDSSLGDMRMEPLQKKLQEVLGSKRFLLVLDDIWEKNHNKLSELKNLIISDANVGSRVVVTTRFEDIAQFIATKQQPYRLGVLDEVQSWSLFKSMAFEDGSRELENSSIGKIEKEIVERCKGIPLAIKTIGNLLYGKSKESEWSSFNKEFSKISEQQDDDILSTLRLSYDHLASHLKLCFAYCSLFPKDYNIEVKTLVNLWMAQGFLKLSDPSQDECLEDVGYDWFMNLLEGSFFQDVEVDECGIIKRCKMHDLMHDLAVQVAGAECATFVISNGQGNIKETTHHVSFASHTYSKSEISVSLAHAKKIRTILHFSISKDQTFCDAIISNYKFIRCLDLHNSRMDLVANSIGKLKHLRYLDLSANFGLKLLPNSITNLLNLQTLKLNHCFQLQELPRDIEKLINLRHLELSSCSKLNSLPSGLGQLMQLRYLDLSWNSGLLLLPDSTNCLSNLQTLKLNHCSELQELPRDIEKLINLRHLEISDCDKLEYVPCGLGQLINLQTLSEYVLMKREESIRRHGGELKELMRLNNLRGELKVTNLSHEKDVAAEYGSAKFKDKKYLRSVSLEWDFRVRIDEAEAIVGYEMSMEGVQPHENLLELTLTNYGGVKLSTWLSSLTNLVNLTLADCKKCEYLVPLNQFHCLKVLNLWWLESLEYVSNNSCNEDVSGSTKTLLPSLQKLWLSGMPNLKRWWREIVISGEEEDKHMSLPCFPSLSTLKIWDCPKLTCMPLYPHLEHLNLMNNNLKPLEETLRMKMSSSAASSFSPLSKLKDLTLTTIEDLECLPDWFKSLTSLNKLDIFDCPELKDLCPGILHLSSLQNLQIDKCKGLAHMLSGDGDDGIMWKVLNGRLHSLQLLSLPNIVTVLPKGIQHLTSLQHLKVYYSQSLTTIPEWIHNLKSLKKLEFNRCPNLTSFPEGIRSLTNLNSLTISSCPMLLKRCKREIGEDWDKISHIQQLELDEEENENASEEETESGETKGCNLFLNKFRATLEKMMTMRVIKAMRMIQIKTRSY
ncbi:disease resistance protein RGA2-like [Humulus lupulus]|uniref:disease resistance protein RGA2-like n=1 Tax=Humulus lupulus TaxID=3486 RepID=UPI002B41208C|nr:disease resistance protein RGA2-like [Humulus lupulus]XP_062117794.1 disease resistance protein RGA2-like [Humulus lupulus]XP_062117795.1 disease resistance protein RGA2-like [Humulus lupulus]XP_062117796.1 disease resistance protein RGA2-like [Humulus lupulus]XP_062117797.1 disease resistance protein RGA2-like [Humulus lupulus]